MKQTFVKIGLAAAASVSIVIAVSSFTQTHAHASTPFQKEAAMTARAIGPFEVKLTPQESSDATGGPDLGRMTIGKQFHGDLEATSKGQMLTAGTAEKSSAGYVAIEKVTGTLSGRRGTFILQHSGTMTRGTPQLTITVVPDSGTDQLAGITGKMNIVIAAEGRHSYEFDYTLPASH